MELKCSKTQPTKTIKGRNGAQDPLGESSVVPFYELKWPKWSQDGSPKGAKLAETSTKHAFQQMPAGEGVGGRGKPLPQGILGKEGLNGTMGSSKPPVAQGLVGFLLLLIAPL